MPRQNKRQTQLPGQKRISDFFGKADDKPADTPSGVKRAIVDEPAEPNKKQMTMSCSDTGEGLASVSEYLFAPSPPSPSYETKTNTRLPKEALTSPSDETKTNTCLPKEALTSPSKKAMTTLESFRVIPSSQDELDDEEMSFETSTDGTLVSPMSVEKSSAGEQDSSSISMIDDHDVDADTLLIEDDEFIPFEDDEAEDENIAAFEIAAEDKSVAQSNNEAVCSIFELAHKKSTVQSADINAERWVKEYDESHPVDKNDEDLQRFEGNFSRFIEGIIRWASDDIAGTDWYKQPRASREMTFGFHAIFCRAAANPAELVSICLDGMPRQVRKVLGKKDLSEIDLLDLPLVPSRCKHRLVYVDVATRFHQDQIRLVTKNNGYGNKPYKAIKPTCDLKEALQTKLYVGSSVNKMGSYYRIQEHEAFANGYFKSKASMHYTEVSQPNVLTNFRLLGVWQNPHANKSYEGQDNGRWIAPMVEGLIMAYLGLYTKANKPSIMPWIFSPSSYELSAGVLEFYPRVHSWGLFQLMNSDSSLLMVSSRRTTAELATTIGADMARSGQEKALQQVDGVMKVTSMPSIGLGLGTAMIENVRTLGVECPSTLLLTCMALKTASNVCDATASPCYTMKTMLR
ncbi:hypothetical protein TsFJ059_003823 [Trichoderma semiorbis]|uniref:Uncharacterized protein n=1 Tax=Trichoderma semiorbis TaxID=1491008 RepID=A0A9P8HUI9_9HYPO|nr:hypothetical protein TsFJ059_003823 [Trichoderma semiorbis]